MHELLQSDLEKLSTLLGEVKKIAIDHFNKIEIARPGRYVDKIENEPLNNKGAGTENVLQYFKENIIPKLAHSTGPNYFGFVTGGSTPASVIGDQLVSIFDQNAFGSHDSIAPLIEHQTIAFLKQLFDLDASFDGSFVTGATMSNFVSLAIARQWAGEQQGKDVSQDGATTLSLQVVSATAHSSSIKALSMLGIGRKNWKSIDTLPEREAIDVDKLESFLSSHTKQSIIVIANAGTVNTGDFDDLIALGKLKEKYNFWLHVDAAFGGFAVLSEKHKHFMQGINYADSITIDAHKWLNVPYDAAMQFTKYKKLQGKVFQNTAAYLSDASVSPDFFHYTPENSRRWRALPTWFTLMAYGREGHAEIVKRNCEAAEHFGELLKQSFEFKLLAPVRLNIVCFTLNEENLSSQGINHFLSQVRDHGKVFFTPTVYKGTPAIRAAISNWLTDNNHMDKAFHVLQEVVKKM
ncbi:tyrosine decarboxylase MfnA [Chryseotalea sanaruensis]|uniref:Tyrosine decarboxylase MfnA n=1 Tax=Chryseotalea sanaruensis TaxID=2482724 RepID=A0A401U9Q4_9BACT|nr:pyridoxal-dependent decarboxylase [Chryseotalea sanaruensis]GCC51619.1 tyrosine decarboxylase MfnA [Chryseotalea sanaruensis]